MKKFILFLLLALAAPLLYSVTVYAGDINGAEQGIIDAISQTQEYEGEYYKVLDGYIGRVTEYLSRDGVDMTQQEADSYVAQFQANIAVGITSGYMVKVSGGEEPSTEEKTGTGNQQNPAGNPGNESQQNPVTDAESGNQDNPAPDTEAGNQDSSAAETGSQQNPAEDAKAGNQDPSAANPENGKEAGLAVQDNTIGSTTDGEMDYTVLPVDRQTMYVWDTDSLEVHREAYKDSDVLGTLKKGDAVAVTGAASTGWAQIEYNGHEGYVSAVWLRTDGYMLGIGEIAATEIQTESETETETETETEPGTETDTDPEPATAVEAISQKDYSDAAPIAKQTNVGMIALAVAVVFCVIIGGIIVWNRSKMKDKTRR